MKLFVYGTLKPGERNYPIYCKGKTLQEQIAYTYGQLFHLSLGYPGLLEGKGKVKGILLTFGDQSVLDNLDELEDYNPMRARSVPSASPDENQYQRKQIPIYSLDDEFIGEAWGYVMTYEKIQQYQGKPVLSGYWTEQEQY